jgi:hypothetical protein
MVTIGGVLQPALKWEHYKLQSDDQGVTTVAEPLELFWLKSASHRYTADNNSTHFKRNNPLVCRVSA